MTELYHQSAPFSIQIEFTEGCNLRCPFCGLQGIREVGVKNYKMMSEETLRTIGRQARVWGSRLEIAMHGEPTMHSDWIGMIRALKEEVGDHCQIMMTSNGGGLLPNPLEKIEAAFAAGLDILALDEYDGIKIVSKVRDAMAEAHDHNAWVHKVYEYPEDSRGNPHHRNKKSDLPFVSLMADPSTTHSAKTPSLTNHCGAAFPLNDKQNGKRCHRPFREMSVRWDGNVAVCCNDWRGDFKCGNVVADGMEAVWQSPAFDAARRKLYRGERDFGPCKGCDARSYRVGLLPDPAGRDEMPEMDADAQAALEAAMVGPSYTVKVPRPWELESTE